MAEKGNKRLQFIMDMVDKVSAPASKVNKSLQDMGKDVTTTQKKLAALNKQAGDISKLAAMRGEMERNNATSKELASKVGQLKVQMAMVEKPTKAMRDALRTATKEQKAHEKASTTQKQALDKVEQGLKKAGVDTSKLSDATRKNRTQTAQASNELRRHSDALQKATSRQNDLTAAKERHDKAMSRAGAMAGTGAGMMAGGAALAGGVFMAGREAYTFDKEMSAVQAIGGMSKEDKARLAARARFEAKSSVFDAAQAAQAQGYLAAAGFSVDDIDKSTNGVLNLAAATGSDLASTADISSNILSGFKMDASQMGRLGDVLTATTTGHNVNLQMLGDTMKYVAPIAAQTGQSVESISAMTGLLGDVGIQGSMAGTALKGAMLRLAGPTASAQKAFDKLGVSTKDVNGNVRDMPDVLAELQTKMKGMGSGDKLSFLKQMFGEEPAAAIAVLLDKAGDTIEAKTKRLYESGGAADKAAKTRLDNLDGDLNNFKGSFSDTMISFGVLFDKTYRGLLRIATKAADFVNDLINKYPKLFTAIGLGATVIGVITAAVGALLVLMAPLVIAWAKLRLAMWMWNTVAKGVLVSLWGVIRAIVVKTATVAAFLVRGAAMAAWYIASKVAFAAWTVACGVARVAMLAFNLALRANPIGLVVTAVMALVAAGVWLYQNWDRLPEAFAEVWASVKEFIGFDPLEAISSAWDAVGEYFNGLFGGIWDKFMNTIGKIGSWMSSGMDWVTGGFGMFDEELAEQVKDAPPAGSATPSVNGQQAVQGGKIPAQQPKTEYNDHSQISLVIHAAPGMDEKVIGDLVVKQMKEERRKALQQERARNKD
ncbi:MAG: phage tail tape measure protein [Aeromonas sp.]